MVQNRLGGHSLSSMQVVQLLLGHGLCETLFVHTEQLPKLLRGSENV